MLIRTYRGQSGFTMIEMLISAVILAIGILGLTLLQTMALRATRGSQDLGIAIQLAEKVMDEVELEGRLTYLNATMTQYTAPGALGSLIYIKNASVDQYYNLDPATGLPVLTTTAAGALFHMKMSQGNYVPGVGLADITVVVTFSDTVNAANQPIQRNATILRRILHG